MIELDCIILRMKLVDSSNRGAVQRGQKVIDSEGKRNFTLKGYGTMLTTILLADAWSSWAFAPSWRMVLLYLWITYIM
jgi:hypothetical protein